MNLMNLGHKNRAVSATAMNDRSSRSHRCSLYVLFLFSCLKVEVTVDLSSFALYINIYVCIFAVALQFMFKEET